jgi:hypothetical protein
VRFMARATSKQSSSLSAMQGPAMRLRRRREVRFFQMEAVESTGGR